MTERQPAHYILLTGRYSSKANQNLICDLFVNPLSVASVRSVYEDDNESVIHYIGGGKDIVTGTPETIVRRLMGLPA